MQPLVTSQQMKAAEAYASTELALPELLLMEHAALAVAHSIRRRFRRLSHSSRGLVLVGPGNNGGDALAAARLLWGKGFKNIEVVLLTSNQKLSPSCRAQFQMVSRLGIAWKESLNDSDIQNCDWVIDGLFGTGLTRPLEGSAKEMVERLNVYHGKKWIVSVDIPSGLCADTGRALGDVAVRASETITFGFIKKGLVTGQAANFVGRLELSAIGIPRSIPLEPQALLYTVRDLQRLSPLRRPASHKGDFGHVAVLVGPVDKAGAAGLVATGALKSGVGLCTLFGAEEEINAVLPRLPLEVMVKPWDAKKSQALPFNDSTIVVAGPGMGTSERSWETLKLILSSNHPVLLDADALTLLSQFAKEAKALLKKRKAVTVMTPHPKEAARLLNVTVEEIESNRYEAALKLFNEWQILVLLKGHGTILSTGRGPLTVVRAGDSGLSKGGSGDVLCGVISALLAQKVSAPEAMALGTYLEGRASCLLTERMGHSFSSLASQIAGFIPDVLDELHAK